MLTNRQRNLHVTAWGSSSFHSSMRPLSRSRLITTWLGFRKDPTHQTGGRRKPRRKHQPWTGRSWYLFSSTWLDTVIKFFHGSRHTPFQTRLRNRCFIPARHPAILSRYGRIMQMINGSRVLHRARPRRDERQHRYPFASRYPRSHRDSPSRRTSGWGQVTGFNGRVEGHRSKSSSPWDRWDGALRRHSVSP